MGILWVSKVCRLPFKVRRNVALGCLARMHPHMDVPSVQYTHTSDGYSIAFMVSGEGPPIVVLPQVFQHCQRIWASGPLAKTLAYLSHRFRIVQYDSRGQGLSQRDLPESTTLEDYLIDLEAVCEACGPG